ncbi:MAG: sigma 54-interacting transcriptional regulator [Acidobacteriia bacterium]|nr:sigma 54-interacting transcriptional regulator [Terriglobia bacterium]
MTIQLQDIVEQVAVAEFVCGTGPSMRAVNAVVTEIARTDIPVLLLGESGTGKGVYARLIHRLSAASSKPMKKVNCSALSAESIREQMLPSLHPSRGEEGCAPGTLFLDEVEELDPGCQRILVGFLPDGEAKNGASEFCLRLISAARHDLEEQIEAGRFRRELYFRINGACLRLPPLRERKEDIPDLLELFLAKHAAQLQRPRPTVSGETLELLLAHAWPGNIRELEHVAKKMVALGDATFALDDLRVAPPPAPKPAETPAIPSLKAAARYASRRTEKELILKALERTRWNRKRAAQELQISYKSLLYKLKQAGIPDSNSREEI